MEHNYRPHVTQPPWKIKARLPHCQIWEHTLSHTIAEAYPIENYERTHARINRNKKHLVNTLGCVFDTQAGCTFLLIERIPNRFSEVMTLNESQTLKVLYASFRGLEELEETYGFVELTESCICFNEDGKVKVWVNSDLSSLHPARLLNSQVKPTEIMKGLVRMVEAKCFNSSFLKKFIKKLEMNEICSFGQAGKEILEIGELLFIDIEEKSMLGYTSQDASHCNNHILQPVNADFRSHTNSTKQLRTEELIQNRDIPRAAVISNHSRKLSNQSTNQINEQKRYESFLDSENSNSQENLIHRPPHLMNLNNISKNQTTTTNEHRSAPLSPRENSSAQKNNKSSSSQNINCSINSKDQTIIQRFIKKPGEIADVERKSSSVKRMRMNGKGIIHIPRNLEFIKRTCPTIREDSKSDDSFSQNLKVEEKEIFVSGQFQTFGILEDLDENAPRSPKFNELLESSLSKEENLMRAASDFNVNDMDKELEKKIQLKANKERERKKVCFLKSSNLVSPIEMRAKRAPNTFKTIHQNQLYGVGSSERAKSITLHSPKSREKENERLKTFGDLSECVSGISYIDKKYEEFLSTVKPEERRKARPVERLEIKYNMKHSKHVSNLERILGTANLSKKPIGPSQFQHHNIYSTAPQFPGATRTPQYQLSNRVSTER